MSDLSSEADRKAMDSLKEKLSSGDIEAGAGELLNNQFAKVAPPGAAGDTVEDLFTTLSRWRFSPEAPVDGVRDRYGFLVRFIKRILRPITTWQLRHITDQLNAYAAVQAEVLRRIAAENEIRSTDRKG